MWPIANRLRESEALVRKREVDLANMAQLSQYIVQHLRESILVVDNSDRIRLINESAAQMLGDRSAYPGALLGEASRDSSFSTGNLAADHGLGPSIPARLSSPRTVGASCGPTLHRSGA